MRKKGFLRRVSIISAIAWFFIVILLGVNGPVGDAGLRESGAVTIVVIAIFGVVCLLSDRMNARR